MRRVGVTALVAAMVALAVTPGFAQEGDRDPLPAGTIELSLDGAIARALGESQEVELARSRVDLAAAQVTAARSQLFPRINANLGFTKTFASAFDAGGGSAIAIPDSLQFNPDPNATLEERVRYLEENAPLAGLGGLGSLFGDLPFGQENAYAATLTGQQTLWSGGRIRAGIDIARHGREAARLTLTEEEAEIELQVRTAYYQALLADELEAIAQLALEQAQAFLDQEELRLSAGQASELEILRADVTLENLRPQLIQARNQAELARLNLKRLTDIPAAVPLNLTTGLMENLAAELAEPGLEPELLVAQRASVLAAARQVSIREEQVSAARAAFQPNVAVQMNYGRQAFPDDIFDLDASWRTDWTATLSVSIPIFTGLQRTAEVEQARAQLLQSRLQLEQLEEAVEIEYQQAIGEKRRAQAEISARQRTVDQAERVYELTVLRYEEGLATQLEVSDARLSLLQARTNLAQAASSFRIADAGVIRSTAGEANIGTGRPVIPRDPAATGVPGSLR